MTTHRHRRAGGAAARYETLAVKRQPIPPNVVEVRLDAGVASFPSSDLSGCMTADEFHRDVVNGLMAPVRRARTLRCKLLVLGWMLPIMLVVAGVGVTASSSLARTPATSQRGVGIALLVIAGCLLVGACVVATTVNQRMLSKITAQAQVLNQLYHERGITFSLYTEVGVALQHLRMATSGFQSLREQPLTMQMIRITFPRAVRAPMDWLTHGCVVLSTPAPGGGALVAPTNRIVGTPIGQVDVPQSWVATAGSNFVLVSPLDYKSPLNGCVMAPTAAAPAVLVPAHAYVEIASPATGAAGNPLAAVPTMPPAALPATAFGLDPTAPAYYNANPSAALPRPPAPMRGGFGLTSNETADGLTNVKMQAFVHGPLVSATGSGIDGSGQASNAPAASAPPAGSASFL